MLDKYELSKLLNDPQRKVLCYLLKKKRARLHELQEITGYYGRSIAGVLVSLTRKFKDKLNIEAWYLREEDLYILNYDALSDWIPIILEICKMQRKADEIEEEIEEFIGSFESYIKRCKGDVMESGKDLVKCWSKFYGGVKVNVIPTGKPGKCRPTLLVFIGSKDDFYDLLLRALKHVMILCPRITREIYFITVKWDSRQWLFIKDLFKTTNTKIYLKLLYTIPTILRLT